jgi:hypothetical protein
MEVFGRAGRLVMEAAANLLRATVKMLAPFG